MLEYEHERTNEIVAKLVKIGRSSRFFLITASMVFGAAVFALIGTSIFPEKGWFVGMIGLAVGYLLGVFAASLTTTVLEWMAQLLVAQGTLMDSLRKRG